MRVRAIKLTVGSKVVGHAVTWSYPKDDGRLYRIPTYPVTVEGHDDAGVAQTTEFEAFRFGIHRPTSKAVASVVGLANQQTHTIKAWLPDYSVHSANSVEKGAWQVYDSFLIHDGPDDPTDTAQPYASIGCVEICRGPRGFDRFNDTIIGLSGSKQPTRGRKLAEIGASGAMEISYLKANRPPLDVIVRTP
jgi:hypothetical protein